MKKLCLIVTMVLLCFAFLAGAPVTEEVVLEVGQKWFRQIFPEKAAMEFEQVQAVEKEGRTLYYILSVKDGGFVLVSADDAAMPILGYSDTGSFEYPITAPAVRYWMNIYEQQIIEAINLNLPNTETLTVWNEIRGGLFSRWESTRDVSPLLNTNWDQGQYYNQLCPTDAAGPGGHAWAGCAATAMAQVMKKWNHPAQGTGSNTYVDGSTFPPAYGTISANFASTTYNWASMPSTLTTYNTAVATLIYHCGVAIDMDYGSTSLGSGAWVFTNDAMEKNFAYNPAAKWHYRTSFSDTAWKNLMRTDMDYGRPVIYNGYDATLLSGHSFVMDGYRTAQDDFHFNFGWGGLYNGYFTLNNIVPATGYDFRYGQWAYYNIYPGVTVSGTITDASSNPLPNVTVSFSGSGGSTTTNSSGFYSIALYSSYSGTATPSLSGYSFTPSSRSYAMITTNQYNQNYQGGMSVPADPSNAFATAMAYDSVQLTWNDNSNNETGFNIYCRLLTDLNWYYRGTVPTDATAFFDSGLMPQQTYIYQVIAFNGAGNSNPAISNQVTTLAPPPPVGLIAPTVNFTDAWLDWTEAGSAPVWDIEFGPPGFLPGTGIPLPMIPFHPFNLQGLQQGTPYDWYVRSFYPSVNVASAWAGPGNFTTLGTPGLSYPWFETFEGGFVNLVNDPANASLWQLNTTLFSEGVQSVRNAYQANANEILISAGTYDLNPSIMPTLYFDHIAKLENNYDHGYVEISIDSGVSWQILQQSDYRGSGSYMVPLYNNPEGPCFMSMSYPEWSQVTPDNTWWRTEEFDLSPYISANAMLRFRLKADSSVQQYGWLIDNVKVMDKPQYSYNVIAPAGAAVGRGLSHDYQIILQNTGAAPDNYTVGTGGIGSWTYGLFEIDGVTPLNLPIHVPPMSSYNFVFKVTTPTTGVNNFDTDNESFTVTSIASGTAFSQLMTTMVLFGDTIADAIVIGSLPFSDNSSTVNYNHDYGPFGPGSGLTSLVNPYTSYFTATMDSSPDVVYQLNLSTPTLLSIDLLGSTYDTAVALVTAPGTAPTDVILINDDYYTTPVNFVSYVNSGCNYVPAGTYYIFVGGYGSASGNYTLNVAAATPPVQPTVTIQYDPAASQVTLNWTQNTVMRYDIYSDTNPYGTYSTTVATNVNAGTYSISPIPSPMMYYKVVEKFCYTYPSKDGAFVIHPLKKE